MVTLFSTGCPKCKVIEKKLQQKNIEHNVVMEAEEIQKLGFNSAPVLKVDEKVYDFRDANRWIMSYEGE
jgi:glutaredoxin